MPYAAPRIALIPAARPDPRQRAVALVCSALVAALLGYLLILGLAPTLIAHVAERITSVTLLPDPPPPPPERLQPQPKPHAARKAGATAPPNIRSKATPVVAPKPIVVLPRPIPVVVAPRPAAGVQSSSGATETAGPGTGAGGIGDGSGSGGEGDGDGDGGSGPVQLSRNLQVSDIRCLRNDECDGSNDVTVYIRFVVGPNGRARDCAVTRSSGRPELDRETCAAIVERLRYRPGTDATGRPVAMNFTGHQRWSGRGDEYDDRNDD